MSSAGFREKEKVHRAGVVPYIIEDQTVKMLFMRPTLHEHQPWMQDKAMWQIAKGRIDDSDISTKDAALREAKEELGLWEGNVVQAYELGTFLGRTTIFAAEVEDRYTFAQPDIEETAETRWMTEEEFYTEGRQLHKTIVSSINKLIMVHHNIVEKEDEKLPEDYDEFENPMALDKWGNRVSYETTKWRKRRR